MTGLDLPQVALAGRSNVGKSSLINYLAGRRQLAKTSATPGKTRSINFYAVSPLNYYLVDLPGYGYAKVPEAMREAWGKVIDAYFRQRQSLAGLVVVMDIRHPLKDYDRQMLDYAAARGLPAHCLLTKADKLGRGEQSKILAAVRRELGDIATAQVFSAESRLGVEEARAVLTGWLDLAGDGA